MNVQLRNVNPDFLKKVSNIFRAESTVHFSAVLQVEMEELCSCLIYKTILKCIFPLFITLSLSRIEQTVNRLSR